VPRDADTLPHAPPVLADRTIRLRKDLSKGGSDAGAETIRAHLLRDPDLTRVPSCSTIWRILDHGPVTTEESSAEQRLYDAAARWSDAPGNDAKDLIDGAVQALVDGLDSPSFRELAGASPSDRGDEIQPLLDAALDELNIPPAGRHRSVQGRWNGHGPVRPHRVPIARCECGEYGCGSTDVTIVGRGDLTDDRVLQRAALRAVPVEGDAADRRPGLVEDASLGVVGEQLGLPEVGVLCR
jgi:hypothetical protein